jgi:hypothetical protein
MKYLVWICQRCESGGLADRIRGLISTYCLSKYLDRHFLIRWEGPDISEFVTIPEEYNFYSKNSCLKNLSEMFFDYIDVAKDCPEDFKDIIGDTDIVYIKVNQNINRKYYKQVINGSEEEYKTTMLNAYRSVFTDFLIPTNALLDYMNQIIPTKPVIGLQLRIGNEQLCKENERYRDKAKPIIEMVLARVEKYIKDNELMVDNDYSYFVTSDCSNIDDVSRNFFGNSREVLSYKGDTMDMGFIRDCDKCVYFKIFADMIMLSKCDILFGTGNSGFSKIPILLSKNKCFICYIYRDYDLGWWLNGEKRLIQIYQEYTKVGTYNEQIIPFDIDNTETSYLYV